MSWIHAPPRPAPRTAPHPTTDCTEMRTALPFHSIPFCHEASDNTSGTASNNTITTAQIQQQHLG